MNKEQYRIRNKKKAFIKKTIENLSDESSQDEKLSLLEDCISLNFFPSELKILTKKWLELGEDIKQINSDIIRMRKNKENTSELRKRKTIHFHSVHINEFKCYKFCYDTGAMLFTEGIYARNHREAWQLASESILDEYNASVLSCFCVSIDDEKTNTLSNMHGMFTPKIGKINGVKAEDLLVNWENEICKNTP